jgi:hypothetical protein
MARRKKLLHKLKNRKSTRKVLNRIKQNNEILKSIK